jgi:hypothetical protein
MAVGWTASSLSPRISAGLAGLRSGGATRGILPGGTPLNSTQSLGVGTGVPPFVQSALNPFLSAVSGAQNMRNMAMGPPQTVNIVNQADLLRAQNEQAAQQAAQSRLSSINLNISRAEDRLRQIAPGPTPIGDVYGPERAALQMRILGLQGQGAQASPFAFGTQRSISPMGGWSSTFAIPAY